MRGFNAIRILALPDLEHRVKGVRRTGVRLRNWLTPELGRQLLQRAASSTPRGLRDHAMVVLSFGSFASAS